MADKPSFTQKLVALLALAATSTAIGYFMKVSNVKGKYHYSPMSAVCMTELFKFSVSSLIIARLVHQETVTQRTDCAEEAEKFRTENYTMKVIAHNAGLALAYAVVNLVTFGVFAYASASTFFLLKAASPIITALMLAALVKRPISGAQWTAIVMQCFGLVATQLDSCKGGTAVPALGYFYIVVNVAVSCGAGVWNEHIIKTFGVSVNAQNSMMYSWGVVINLFMFFVLPPEAIGGEAGVGFFENYNWSVMGVIAATGSVGLVITAVYKYADVVVKTFGLAGSTVILYVLESLGMMPSSNPSGPPQFVTLMGAALVFYASFVYIAPPLEEDMAVVKATDDPVEATQKKVVPLMRNMRVGVLCSMAIVLLFGAATSPRRC